MNYIKTLTISLLLMLSFNSIASATSEKVKQPESQTTEKKESIKEFYEAQIILNNIITSKIKTIKLLRN